MLKLFKDWGEDYETAFIAGARNVLRDVMADFDALSVFYDRSSIEAAMRTKLTDLLLVSYGVNI